MFNSSFIFITIDFIEDRDVLEHKIALLESHTKKKPGNFI